MHLCNLVTVVQNVSKNYPTVKLRRGARIGNASLKSLFSDIFNSSGWKLSESMKVAHSCSRRYGVLYHPIICVPLELPEESV